MPDNTNKPIKDRKPTKLQVVDCGFCKGRGECYEMRAAPSGHRAIRLSKYAWGRCQHCEGTGKRKNLIFSHIICLDKDPETGKPLGIIPNPNYDSAPDVFLDYGTSKRSS